jgi:hypothetical protein
MWLNKCHYLWLLQALYIEFCWERLEISIKRIGKNFLLCISRIVTIPVQFRFLHHCSDLVFVSSICTILFLSSIPETTLCYILCLVRSQHLCEFFKSHIASAISVTFCFPPLICVCCTYAHTWHLVAIWTWNPLYSLLYLQFTNHSPKYLISVCVSFAVVVILLLLLTLDSFL